MNKKILIPALLITTLAGAGGVTFNYQMLAERATTLFQSTYAQQDLISQIQQKIEEIKVELSRLINERDQMVKSTIIKAGCFVITVNPDDAYNGSKFFDIPYKCPDSQTQRILEESIISINNRLIQYNSNINQLREQLRVVEAELAVLISSQATSPMTGTMTDASPDTEYHGAAPETDAGDTSTQTANMALLNQFLLTPNPELEASVEQGYFQEVKLHGSAVPQIQLDGPNGPVSANFQDGLITLSEEVVLGPGKSLNLPQMGISISNQEEPKTTSQNLFGRFISKTFANNSISANIRLFPDLSIGSLVGYEKVPFEYFIDPERNQIAVVANFYFFQAEYLLDNQGNISFRPYNENGSAFDSYSLRWGTIRGSATFGSVDAPFFDQVTNGLRPEQCSIQSTVVNSCEEKCMNETITVCLECIPPLEEKVCAPPKDKAKYCKEACSKESILNEIEYVPVIC